MRIGNGAAAAGAGARVQGGRHLPARSVGVHPGPGVRGWPVLRKHWTERRVVFAPGRGRAPARCCSRSRSPASTSRKGSRWSATSCCSSRGSTTAASSTTARRLREADIPLQGRRLGPGLRRRRRPGDERRLRHAHLPRPEDPGREPDAAGARRRPAGAATERAGMGRRRDLGQRVDDRSHCAGSRRPPAR